MVAPPRGLGSGRSLMWVLCLVLLGCVDALAHGVFGGVVVLVWASWGLGGVWVSGWFLGLGYGWVLWMVCVRGGFVVRVPSLGLGSLGGSRCAVRVGFAGGFGSGLWLWFGVARVLLMGQMVPDQYKC